MDSLDIVRRLAQSPDLLEAIIAHRYYMPLLPLLEKPHADVASLLPQALLRAGVSTEDCERFSLRDLVVFAVESDSEYWADLAVRWLEDGFAVDAEIVRGIDSMVKQKKATQGIGHRAFRLARNWEKQRLRSD